MKLGVNWMALLCRTPMPPRQGDQEHMEVLLVSWSAVGTWMKAIPLVSTGTAIPNGTMSGAPVRAEPRIEVTAKPARTNIPLLKGQ
jgi:hypothetical protein